MHYLRQGHSDPGLLQYCLVLSRRSPAFTITFAYNTTYANASQERFIDLTARQETWMTVSTEAFTRRCLEAGFRITEPRRAIIELLATTDDHPTTEDIHWRLRDNGHTISLATVYRTMRLMEELGLLDKHQFDGGNMRYEMAADKSHDHLIDIEDRTIVEFTDPEIESRLKAIAERLGYSLVDHRLELYGKKARKEA